MRIVGDLGLSLEPLGFGQMVVACPHSRNLYKT